MKGRPITVVIADDHALLRSAFGLLLRSHGDSRLVGAAADADGAIATAAAAKPDVVILDIDMPGRGSFEAAREIKRSCPGARVIFLSAYVQDRFVEQALAVEASAYVTKGEPPEAILKAIRTVAEGGVYFSPQVLDRIVIDSRGARLATVQQSRFSTLTRREREVLVLVARGKSKKEIADELGLSLNTVNRHTSGLMAKLKIHDRVQLARFAIREGLVEA
ncbi:MAG: response regulator transcription factor [Planctomycetes bacterium]|nr:response regulator transcription factor [Planctomycetota bacterium]